MPGKALRRDGDTPRRTPNTPDATWSTPHHLIRITQRNTLLIPIVPKRVTVIYRFSRIA